jgi:hypothetical protein
MGYYYHWMRDGGLCIKTWLDINDNNYEAVRTELEAYAGWVAKERSLNFTKKCFSVFHYENLLPYLFSFSTYLLTVLRLLNYLLYLLNYVFLYLVLK